jgi:hypothetical protein
MGRGEQRPVQQARGAACSSRQTVLLGPAGRSCGANTGVKLASKGDSFSDAHLDEHAADCPILPLAPEPEKQRSGNGLNRNLLGFCLKVENGTRF